MAQPGQARPSKRDERVTVWPLPPAEAFRALLGGPVEQGDGCDAEDGYGEKDAPAPGQ